MLDNATDHDAEFYEAVLDRLNHLLRRRMRIRLVGLSLSALAPRSEAQGLLFDGREREKRKRLYTGLDRLRERFGFDIVSTGPSLKIHEKRDDE